MPKRPPSSRKASMSGPLADPLSPGLTVRVMLILIRVYRLVLSPVLPAACRYAPSCSTFAAEAIARHGALAGGVLAARRLMRCHPWSAGGYDPVPAGRE